MTLRESDKAFVLALLHVLLQPLLLLYALRLHHCKPCAHLLILPDPFQLPLSTLHN